MRLAKVKAEDYIYNNMTHCLAYADNVVITGKDQNFLLETLAKCQEVGLIINESNTKYMVSSRKGPLNGNLTREERREVYVSWYYFNQR